MPGPVLDHEKSLLSRSLHCNGRHIPIKMPGCGVMKKSQSGKGD